MRKTVIMMMALAAMAMTATTAWGQGSDFFFQIVNDRGTLQHYSGPGGDVVIPSTFRDVEGEVIQVTMIGESVFAGNTTVTSVTIPAGVTTISSYAFQDCSSLVRVVLPEGLYGIYYKVFAGCTSLESINIPNSVTGIGGYAFAGCTSLKSINIPNSLTSIEVALFSECSALESVTLPEGVTSIGDYAFFNCAALSGITLPEGVTSIGLWAFYNCTSLSGIDIPASVIYIGHWAFRNCTSLVGVHCLNPTPPRLGDDVFWFGSYGGLYNGTDVPNGMLVVPEGSEAAYRAADQWKEFGTIVSESVFGFDGSRGAVTGYTGQVGKVTVPATIGGVPVTIIAGSAFANRPTLTGVSLPAGVTLIGAKVFAGCTALRSVSLPEGLIYIGSGTFGGCSALTSLTIPRSVLYIGWAQFEGCTKLSELHILNPTPPTILREQPDVFNEAQMFAGLPAGRALVVPDGSKAAYQAADMWSTFGNIYAESEYAPYWSAAASTDFTAQNGVITQYNGTGGNVAIPDNIGGWTVTGIGSGSVAGNTALTGVRIPAGVTHIDNDAFAGCTNLSQVFFADSSQLQRIESSAFLNCTSLQTLTLPDSLQSIGNYAFFGCSSLQTVTLGSATASVGTMAFYLCPAIATLNSRNLTPPAAASDAFSSVSAANVSLFVPETSAAAYQAANTWQNFTRLTADIPVGHDTVWNITHKDTTIVDTTHVPVTVYDTTRRDTTIVDTTRLDTTIVDTTRRDTTIVDTLHRDSIIYDTIYHRDSTVIDSILHRDSIIYDSIYHRDTIVYDTTWHHTDSTVIDTLRDTIPITITDTTHVDTTIVDTTLVELFDTTWQTVDAWDTVWEHVTLTDTTLAPETLFVYDTIIEEREVPVYIVVDPVTATKTVVSEDARAVDGANGVILEGLTPGEVYAVYSVTGTLVVRAIATESGTALLRDLSPGPYLLWHMSRWTKFTHR